MDTLEKYILDVDFSQIIHIRLTNLSLCQTIMKELKAMSQSEKYMELKLDRTLKKLPINRVVNTDYQFVYVF